jgi:hypothetical protein
MPGVKSSYQTSNEKKNAAMKKAPVAGSTQKGGNPASTGTPKKVPSGTINIKMGR